MAGEPTMTLGDRDGTGDWLQYLHQLLVRHGYATGTAEVYDEATEQAVRAFQGQYGLPETGVADAGTWHALQFEPGSNWTDFRLAFQEFPGVRDGALVWTLRNDGPYPASQFVEHATFVDYDTADEAGTVERGHHETLQPWQTAQTRVTADEMRHCLHEGRRYRMDVTLNVDGEGGIGSLLFRVEGGRFAEY